MTEVSIAQYVNQDAVLKNIQEVLRDRTPQFITSMVSLVNSDQKLKTADKKSVMAACLTAAALNLPVNPSLGMAYIIPYKQKDGTLLAQFQIGWKGLIDLAIRTKRYKHINVTDVREGELVGTNRLKGTIDFNWIQDESQRAKAKIVGYISFFELTEGFEKTLYMTSEELKEHAQKYSQSYRRNSPNMNKWRDDFDAMSKKTVLKLLINRFGPKNAELERALEADQSAVDDQGTKYLDNMPIDPNAEADLKEIERIKKYIQGCKTLADLEKCRDSVNTNENGDELLNLFFDKEKELKAVKK